MCVFVCVCACVEHGREYIWYGTLFHLCTVHHSYYVDHQATLYFKVLSVAISSSLHFLFSAHTINNSSSNLVFKREICFLSCSVFILFFRFFFSFQERRRRRRKNALLFIFQNPSNPLSPLFFSLRPHMANKHISSSSGCWAAVAVAIPSHFFQFRVLERTQSKIKRWIKRKREITGPLCGLSFSSESFIRRLFLKYKTDEPVINRWAFIILPWKQMEQRLGKDLRVSLKSVVALTR